MSKTAIQVEVEGAERVRQRIDKLRRIRGDAIDNAVQKAHRLFEVAMRGDGCHDCLKPYEDFSLDVTVPDDLWERIAPREGGHGLLCANCIVKRLSELEPSPVTVRLTPVWAEDYD